MTTAQEIIQGLQIFEDYATGPNSNEVACEHDIMYAGPAGDKNTVSPEHKKELKKLNWHWDSEFDCWAKYV